MTSLRILFLPVAVRSQVPSAKCLLRKPVSLEICARAGIERGGLDPASRGGRVRRTTRGGGGRDGARDAPDRARRGVRAHRHAAHAVRLHGVPRALHPTRRALDAPAARLRRARHARPDEDPQGSLTSRLSLLFLKMHLHFLSIPDFGC